MKAISKRFRDQPQDSLKRAVFWAEYALRQGGAEHLRVAPRDMSFIQTNNFDIYLLLLTIFALILYLIYKFVSSIIGRSSDKEDKKLKNKKLQ